MPDCVKPNPKKLKRSSVKSCETGFLDYLYVALDEDLVTYPAKPVLTGAMTYAAFATATGSFGTTAVWSKIECKKGSVKLQSKSLNLKDTSAVENTVMFAFDNSKDTLGFREMYKRADIQVVLPKANGDLIWVGRQDSPAQIEEFTDDQSIEKSADELQIKSSPFSYLYLASGTVITPVVEA